MKPTDPFDMHLASAVGLEERARELVDLAEQAGDQEAVMARAFRPAVASWEGVAAPELRTAPEGVREQAGLVASRLSWAAVPLRFWAEQVRLFNAKVGGLRDRRDRVPADVERHVREVYGDDLQVWPLWELDHVRRVKRDELIRGLEGEWHNAFAVNVDEGERAVVRMLRNGPTWENMQVARQVGVIPGGPMLEFFTARWSRAAALVVAGRIAGLVTGGTEPTLEEKQLFGELLGRYAGDDEFAYLLLTGLGPEGLLMLTGGVGLLGREGSGTPWHRALGAVQAGLAVALATGTRRRGTGGGHARSPYQPGVFELSPEWVLELTRAGRQQVLLGVPPVQIYGYQPMGVLLGHGGYDDLFLSTVGSDMIDFELEQGGSGFWADGVPDLWMRLDWIGGGDVTEPAGFDPIIGLMDALAENPEATREIFTSRVLYDGAPGGRLPRLDYLLTDREWPADWMPGPASLGQVTAGPDHVSTGITALGAALEGATTNDPDERSYRIVESIIYEVANDEQAQGYPNGQPNGPRAELFRNVDIVDDDLRPFLGRIGAFYIDDIHWTLASVDAATSGVPHDSQLRQVDARDLQIFLADLGKNPTARDTVVAAEYLYADMLYHHYLDGWDGVADPQILDSHAMVASPAARLLAAADFGAASQLRSEIADQDAAGNNALHSRFFWAGLASSATNTTTPYSGGPVGYVIQQNLDHLEQSLRHDSTGAANYYVGDLKDMSRQILTDMINRAAYDSITRELTPGELLARVADADFERVEALLHPEGHPQAGEFVPMPEWGDNQQTAWGIYVTTVGNGGPAVLVDSGLASYNQHFETTRSDLEGDSHTRLPQ